MAQQPEYVNVDHISLTVRDMDAAKVFYADQLGMPVITDVEVEDKASGTPIYDMVHSKRRMVVLGPVGNVNLALISHPGDELQGEPILNLDRVGLTHYAFNVRDLPALVERMASFGIEPVARGFFRDPEGNLVQFEEPGQSDRINQHYVERNAKAGGTAAG
jgi:catechol 2,3-dioxygenase-like lactoylglutathione lyase family enzyme